MAVMLAASPVPPPARPGGRKARAAALAFGAVLLWALWPTLGTLAQPAPPFLVLGLGAAVGYACAIAGGAASGRLDAFIAVPAPILVLVTVGILGNNALYLSAMPRIGPAEANLVHYLWPVMLAGLGAVSGRARLGLTAALGIGLAFAGVGVVIAPGLGAPGDTAGAAAGPSLAGYALGVSGALVFAVYAFLRASARGATDAVGPALGPIALVALGLHLAVEAPVALAAPQLVAIALIGIGPLGLSNMLWDRACRTGELPTIAAIAYATPVFAVLMLAAAGLSALRVSLAVGAFMVVAGALLAARPTGGRR